MKKIFNIQESSLCNLFNNTVLEILFIGNTLKKSTMLGEAFLN